MTPADALAAFWISGGVFALFGSVRHARRWWQYGHYALILFDSVRHAIRWWQSVRDGSMRKDDRARAWAISRTIDEGFRTILKGIYVGLAVARADSLLREPPPNTVLADWIGVAVYWAFLLLLTLWTQLTDALRERWGTPSENPPS